MFGLLEEVLAAWAALLPKSSSRQGTECLRLPGSRSNCLIFAQPTRIACLAQQAVAALEEVVCWVFLTKTAKGQFVSKLGSGLV